MSHYLDLTARTDDRAPALHGAQVGVATLVAARAYERSWAQLDWGRVAEPADPASCRRLVEREFLRLDQTGRIAAEIWRDLEKKLARWNAAVEPRRDFARRAQAGELDDFLSTNVRSATEVAAIMARATAPRRFADLTEPIPAATAHAAVLHSHLVRARFTLGDLLAHASWLKATTPATLLDEPGFG
jgi:glycerol-1-phosphate dehydrogenase [NAD(P)+]